MDARIRYTKKAIKEVFLELLKEMPLGKITVTKICERAEINRATFYKYYDNPIDLMNKLEDELISEIQEKIEALESRTVISVFETILYHIADEIEVFRTLISDNGDATFKDRVFKLCYVENMQVIRSLFPEVDHEKQKMFFYFLGEGCGGILNRWVYSGVKEDISEIVQFTESIIETLNQYWKP